LTAKRFGAAHPILAGSQKVAPKEWGEALRKVLHQHTAGSSVGIGFAMTFGAPSGDGT
jgi:hypothetical protein